SCYRHLASNVCSGWNRRMWWAEETARKQAATSGPSANEEMQLTNPGFLVGKPTADVRCRRAVFIESGFAADLRCSADAGARTWKRRVTGGVVGGCSGVVVVRRHGRQPQRLHPRERAWRETSLGARS